MEEEAGDEAKVPNADKLPARPSQEEVDQHMLTHLPFRSWCPHCVRGKAKRRAHRKKSRKSGE